MQCSALEGQYVFPQAARVRTQRSLSISRRSFCSLHYDCLGPGFILECELCHATVSSLVILDFSRFLLRDGVCSTIEVHPEISCLQLQGVAFAFVLSCSWFGPTGLHSLPESKELWCSSQGLSKTLQTWDLD